MTTTAVTGLTQAQVDERIAAGQVNVAPSPTSRSLSSILRANILTWFNALVGSLWIVMLIIAPVQDSLFGFIIVANTLIGVVQEYRASRTLAKLAVLGEAQPTVRRDGVEEQIPSASIVLDDVVVLATGDQLVVDGEILESYGLEIDESLLTGEADPVDKVVGDEAMSGSFVVAGTGTMRANRVGREAFAAGLTEQARSFQQTNSELRDAINGFIRGVSYLLLPVGVLLLISQLVRLHLPLNEALRGTIAGVITMVPEGLVLLTSIAMAVSVIRLAQRRVLVQDLPAVEVLARVDTVCVWVLGAPEFVLPDDAEVARRASVPTADGARVLLLARADGTPSAQGGTGPVTPIALVVISQTLRPDAHDTVAYFLTQGVRIKVISGDNPATVGAIAARAGVPGAQAPVDARTLPTDPDELGRAVDEASVFGRVTPTQKQAMVAALRQRGATVAMTGDGVNDVLALKTADLGIAMGSGAGATRAVAQLVLMDDQWSVMPDVVAEGRRVLGNIERVSDVFLTKSFYAIVVSVLTGIFAFTFPFLPRHLSLVSGLTIGIPGFFLALMPNTERFRPGFFRRVLLFAAPAGVICAATALAAYYAIRSLGEPVPNAQAGATTALFVVTLAVLTESARPLNALRLGIVALMAVMFVGVLVIPWFANTFALHLGAERYAVVAVGIGLIGAALVWAATLVTDRWRRA